MCTNFSKIQFVPVMINLSCNTHFVYLNYLTFVFKVNRHLGLSPGYFTHRLAKIRDIQHKKRKAIANTFKAKHKRRLLKSKRYVLIYWLFYAPVIRDLDAY